jgi:hypothetical protein
VLPPNRVERRRAGCGSPKIDSRTCLPSFGSSRIGSETFLPNCRTPKMGSGTCLPSSGTWEIGSGTFLRSSPQAPPRLDFNHPQLGVDKPQLGRGWSAARHEVVCSSAEGGLQPGRGWSARRGRVVCSSASTNRSSASTNRSSETSHFGSEQGGPRSDHPRCSCGDALRSRGPPCFEPKCRLRHSRVELLESRCPVLLPAVASSRRAVPVSRRAVVGR